MAIKEVHLAPIGLAVLGSAGAGGDLGRRRAAGDRLDGRAGVPGGEQRPPVESRCNAGVHLVSAGRISSLRRDRHLVAIIAGLVVASFVTPIPVPLLICLVVPALVLDAVDGWVARRTGTTTELGARFDMEVDAFLLLVLSAYVAPILGPWVLAIGLMRYVFVAAGWMLPWLRLQLPPRYWRKVVTAVQGIALTLAASGLVPELAGVLVGVALVLLVESFGRDVVWLALRSRARQAEVGAS